MDELGFTRKDGEREVTLMEKLEEYVMRIGYSNAYVLSILVQLLVHGKVKVDFRNYSERLQLLDLTDRINRPQALKLIDFLIEELQGSQQQEKNDMTVTQRIIITQPTRRPTP